MFQGMEYIYTVYQEKSFSKAARKLFISQPSLSATVKRIEEHIGYPIFDRSTKPLTLTEFGKRYISSVEQIISVEHEFSSFMNDWGGLKTGKLVLGGSSLFSSWVLPPLIGSFTRQFPMVKVELMEENTSELKLLLQNGGIDLMIDNCQLDKTAFDSRVYRTEYLLLAVPAALDVNREAARYQIPLEMIHDGSFLDSSIAPVPLERFSGEPYIMLKPDNDTRKRAVKILAGHNITPDIRFELDQQLTSYNITCSGMGISFISDTLIKRVPFHPGVVYYKLDGSLCQRNLYFYWKNGRYFSRAMEEFLNIAKGDAKPA